MGGGYSVSHIILWITEDPCGERVPASLAEPWVPADRQQSTQQLATEASEVVEGAFEVRLGRCRKLLSNG